MISVDGRSLSCDPTCTVEVVPDTVPRLEAAVDPGCAFHSWSPAELCDNPQHSVCNLALGMGDRQIEAYLVKNLTNLWALSIGGQSFVDATSVAVDSHGNVLVGGVFQGEIAFGEQKHVSRGSDDGFVAKYDRFGKPLASFVFGTAGPDRVSHVVSRDGGVLVTAWLGTLADGSDVPIYVGGAQLRSRTDAHGEDGALFDLDATLALRGALHLRGYGAQELTKVAVSGQGRVIAVGSVGGSVDTGTGAPLVSDDADIAIATVVESARPESISLIGGPGHQAAGEWVARAQGGFFLSGSFRDKASLGGPCPTLTAPYNQDAHGFIARFDEHGKCVSARRIVQGTEVAGVNALAVDPTGNLLVMGTFRGSVDLSGGIDPKGVLPLKSPLQHYVAKLGPDLEWMPGSSWVARTDGDLELTSIAADGTGNLLVAGARTGQHADAPESYGDIVLTKLDATGKVVVTRDFGGRSAEHSTAVAWDASSLAWVVVGSHGDGMFSDPIDFGGIAPNPLYFDLGSNALIAKFSP